LANILPEIFLHFTCNLHKTSIDFGYPL